MLGSYLLGKSRSLGIFRSAAQKNDMNATLYPRSSDGAFAQLVLFQTHANILSLCLCADLSLLYTAQEEAHEAANTLGTPQQPG